MEKMMNVASYFFNRYLEEYGTKIDEMKLHKLMYFSQREAFVQNNEPLFDAVFYGWKYGPVLKEIRESYRSDGFKTLISVDSVERMYPVVNKVFEDYAHRDSWSLSRLTHGEYSWKNSRVGIKENEISDRPMRTEDIARDAERIRIRRSVLSNFISAKYHENN